MHLEVIEVGDVEGADTEPGQGEQMRPADPAEAGDGDAGACQRALLICGYPSDIARESTRAIEDLARQN